VGTLQRRVREISLSGRPFWKSGIIPVIFSSKYEGRIPDAGVIIEMERRQGVRPRLAGEKP